MAEKSSLIWGHLWEECRTLSNREAIALLLPWSTWPVILSYFSRVEFNSEPAISEAENIQVCIFKGSQYNSNNNSHGVEVIHIILSTA